VTVRITGWDLSLDQLVAVARQGEMVDLSLEAQERMRATREVVEEALRGDFPVYGFNRGVNAKKESPVTTDQVQFNRLLLASHRVGQGPPAPADVTRATLLVLANQLAAGWAGVRPELVTTLVQGLNDNRLPVMRMLGSVGQGDLAPLADLTYGLVSDLPLAAGEALALVDNNAFSTALAALAIVDSTCWLDSADVLAALDMEAFAANLSVLHPEVARSRPYAGLQATVARLSGLLEGSHLWTEGSARNLQDPLSFRCVPQVHGAARDAIRYAAGQVEIELRSSQGNPIVDLGLRRAIPAGNFDVLPVAAAMDLVRLALAPVITGAAERAVKLLQAPQSGLPQGLSVAHPVAEDALSELGVAAVALAAEARLLAQPVSFEVTSTSIAQGIEDRVTMAPLAARRLAEMVDLGARLAAIEAVVAAQAVDLRRPPALGGGTAAAHRLVREIVPFTEDGTAPPHDLEPLRELLRSGALAAPGTRLHR
jgi:histidine ammonia-lyase